MPLEVEEPTSQRLSTESIVVGLVNNMPDTALTATVRQFASLLAGAAGPLPVRLRVTYLAEVPRTTQASEYIAGNYWPLDRILDEIPDALIVTGTEPCAATLEEEPYWGHLVQLLSWAQEHVASSIWSCLAAHAAVQALNGIRRSRLSVKRFGVFEHTPLSYLPLLSGVTAPLLTPHSRWNELSVEELRSAGYTIASASSETGADVFVRQERSLLVGLQGHPEYEDTTLLKEYRRDVGRFLRGEQDLWPAQPEGYFQAEALQILEAFRRRAEPAREPALLDEFPTDALAGTLRARWRPAALRIYRNWLSHLADTRKRAHLSRRVQV